MTVTPPSADEGELNLRDKIILLLHKHQVMFAGRVKATPAVKEVMLAHDIINEVDYILERYKQQATVAARVDLLDKVQEAVNSCRELDITDLELYKHQSGEELPAINRHALNSKLTDLRQHLEERKKDQQRGGHEA